MPVIRQPAVAGTFYPDDSVELETVIKNFIANNQKTGPVPKAIIAPHAGYIYSAPVAASVYSIFQNASNDIRKIVIFGPAHRLPFDGLAIPSVEQFATPLGTIALDTMSLKTLEDNQLAIVLDKAHEYEHCLEVQLPFLQTLFDSFTLTPVLVGHCDASRVEQALELLWGDQQTLIIISSDLSHYHSYEDAKVLDQRATLAIEQLDSDTLDANLACGSIAINGLLKVAKKHRLKAETIDVRNSGDTAGPQEQVVGYGAYAFR